MNLLRKAEELREYVSEALKASHFMGAKTENAITKLAYGASSLIGKIGIWKDSGAKTFVLSKELVEAFQHTDIPFDLYPSDFHYPFGVFVIESDVPLFKTDTVLGEKNVYAILFIDGEYVKYDGKTVFITGEGEVRKELDWDKAITAFYPGEDDVGIENMMIHMGDHKQIYDAIETPKLDYGMYPLSKSDAQNMINIFYNTVLYISDPGRKRDETEIHGTRNLKLGKGKKTGSMGYVLLKPPKNYVSMSDGSGRAIDKRFVVRGHWRMQPYGEKHSLRKHIWIKPFWKGDLLAEVINKPYKVE